MVSSVAHSPKVEEIVNGGPDRARDGRRKTKPIEASEKQLKAIEKLAAEIKAGTLTDIQVAEKVGVTVGIATRACKKVRAGEDPTKRKELVQLTKEQRKKILSFLPQVREGTISKADVARSCGNLPEDTVNQVFRSAMKAIKSEEFVAQKKKRLIKLQDKESIIERCPSIMKGTFSVKKVAEELDIDEGLVDSIYKDWFKEASADRKVKKMPAPKRENKVTDEKKRKFMELVPQLTNKTLSYSACGKACGVATMTVFGWHDKVKKGIDIFEKQKAKSTSSEKKKEIKGYVSKIQSGKMTLKAVADKFDVSVEVVRLIVRRTEAGIDATKKKEMRKLTEDEKKKIEETIIPRMKNDGLSLQKACAESGYSKGVINALLNKSKLADATAAE